MVTAAERRQLESAFECDPSELNSMLKKCDAAAREEYLAMILGQKALTRGQDIREYRLFLLIQHVFGGELPRERTISNLFQTTAGQSRSLLRAVISKYQYLMRPGIDATLKKMVQSAVQTQTNGPWTVSSDSENRVELLNREISGINPMLAQVSRAPHTVGTYEISNASYLELKRRYGL